MFENLKPIQEFFFFAMVVVTAAIAFFRAKQLTKR